MAYLMTTRNDAVHGPMWASSEWLWIRREETCMGTCLCIIFLQPRHFLTTSILVNVMETPKRKITKKKQKTKKKRRYNFSVICFIFLISTYMYYDKHALGLVDFLTYNLRYMEFCGLPSRFSFILVDFCLFAWVFILGVLWLERLY